MNLLKFITDPNIQNFIESIGRRLVDRDDRRFPNSSHLLRGVLLHLHQLRYNRRFTTALQPSKRDRHQF